MEEARLRWAGKGSRTSSKMSRVEQLFERQSPFYQWHRTIYDEIRSVLDVSASLKLDAKISLKMSEHNDGEIDYVTNLQRRAITFLADLRTHCSLNF
jgi:hypothetical protein